MTPQIVELIHTFLCDKKHTHRIEDLKEPYSEDICYFYVESQIDEGDTFLDHITWQEKAQKIVTYMGLTDDQMIKFLDRLSEVTRKVHLLELDFPSDMDILKQVLRF